MVMFPLHSHDYPMKSILNHGKISIFGFNYVPIILPPWQPWQPWQPYLQLPNFPAPFLAKLRVFSFTGRSIIPGLRNHGSIGSIEETTGNCFVQKYSSILESQF